MSESLFNFATDFDDDPVGALAFTDFTKPGLPVLEGEDAERFVRMMEENEKKAEELAKRPRTKTDIENELSFKKMILEYELRELENLKKDIEKLEKLYAETKEE